MPNRGRAFTERRDRDQVEQSLFAASRILDCLRVRRAGSGRVASQKEDEGENGLHTSRNARVVEVDPDICEDLRGDAPRRRMVAGHGEAVMAVVQRRDMGGDEFAFAHGQFAGVAQDRVMILGKGQNDAIGEHPEQAEQFERRDGRKVRPPVAHSLLMPDNCNFRPCARCFR